MVHVLVDEKVVLFDSDVLVILLYFQYLFALLSMNIIVPFIELVASWSFCQEAWGVAEPFGIDEGLEPATRSSTTTL